MKTKVTVTDHALIRYLERVLEIDVEALRRKLADEVMPGAVSGAKSYRAAGAVFVMERDASRRHVTVVTVVTNDMREGMKGRAHYTAERKADMERRRARQTG